MGDSSMAEGVGGFELLYVSNAKRPCITEPDPIFNGRLVTSAPLTATGSIPNSTSVHEFDRPRSAWITYWPDGTLGNSNRPSGRIRAPTGTAVPDVERSLGISLTVPPIVGSPVEMSMPATSCDRSTETYWASLGVGVPGKYARAYTGTSLLAASPTAALTMYRPGGSADRRYCPRSSVTRGAAPAPTSHRRPAR